VGNQTRLLDTNTEFSPIVPETVVPQKCSKTLEDRLKIFLAEEMNNQVIFEYRVSGFFTDTISTHEKDLINEDAKSKQNQWSFRSLFPFQSSFNQIEETTSAPWHVSLESKGGLVAFLQV
jgi:hypothetical protein